jgi:hypothetical protein
MHSAIDTSILRLKPAGTLCLGLLLLRPAR